MQNKEARPVPIRMMVAGSGIAAIDLVAPIQPLSVSKSGLSMSCTWAAE